MSQEQVETFIQDSAVTDGGAYEVLRRRLTAQGDALKHSVEALNCQRLAEFGSQRMDVLGRVRIRTENNCIARDIVRTGHFLLFGYNVFLGLKVETAIDDVFALYRLAESPDGYEAQAVELADTFLNDPGFRRDFAELYNYYRDARLLQLLVRDSKLLISFQVGERVADIRVFRWSISTDGSALRYIDNRGERDISPLAQYDFQWLRASREMQTGGRHPHISILDAVHLQVTAGELVIKVENNTRSGLEIYREPVVDKHQSLDDLQVEFARLGSLLLLKVRPYKEEQFRYLVCNTLTQTITRIDAIGLACQQLPEDHGVIFPGGFYLQNGDYKTFDQSMEGMQFKRTLRSPNGEDFLYVFYHPFEGRSALFTYNTISRQLQNPIFGHGYASLEDGRMVIFSAEAEPTRNHPMQIWQTPFHTDEFASRQPDGNTFIGKIGNADLVRAISEIFDLVREINAPDVSAARFAQLHLATTRLFDGYHWLGNEQAQGIGSVLREIGQTGEAIVDEFEKVEAIRTRSAQALEAAQRRHTALLGSLTSAPTEDIQHFVGSLSEITELRGHLLTIKEHRYIDVARIDRLEQELIGAYERVADDTANFISRPQALATYSQQIERYGIEIQGSQTAFALDAPLANLAEMATGLDMLSALASSLKIDDATQRTLIIESISEVYARLNQALARGQLHLRNLKSSESIAQFAAQFKLFSQGITHALSFASTPETCDEQLSKLLIQLEELESRFAEHPPFLNDIMLKREEVLEAFEQHKQRLTDARQRQAQALADTAVRILEGLGRRIAGLGTLEQLNGFFASDLQVIKLLELSARLRSLDDSVKADDIDARLKAVRDRSISSQRDKADLFEDGGRVIKLGPRHRFSVNTQELELTLLPRGEQLCLHVTGSDYFEALHDPEIAEMRPWFHAVVESETDTLYRSQYLAWQVLDAAQADATGLTALRDAYEEHGTLEKHVREFCAPLYREGYVKGVHDHDAALILMQLLQRIDVAGLLRFAPDARALALLAWHLPGTFAGEMQGWPERARSNAKVLKLFKQNDGQLRMRDEVARTLQRYVQATGLPFTQASLPATLFDESAEYLLAVLAQENIQFEVSRHSRDITLRLVECLDTEGYALDFIDALKRLSGDIGGQWNLISNWVLGICRDPALQTCVSYAPEAIATLLLESADVDAGHVNECELAFAVDGLLGEHPLIMHGALNLSVDGFFARLREHRDVFLPGMRRYQSFKQAVVSRERQALRLADFKPRPLTSFVRNKLINEVYLPLIADNLAKQTGTVGENKRSDLMGLLMLISPPGYGKTTLMEYIASRLGMAFVKINGPALGHGVKSLDPDQAPDGPSRMELEKLNLALEMGNNVCLLIDDIQHLSSEFLQKFIPLCDGTRRIEGVWKGQAKSCDLRGKKFCIVMAGNPYTESGSVFKVPDMLVNRADIYNLGDVTGGNDGSFALSYIENCMTSNPLLAPLANRDINDVYRLLENAQGQTFSSNDLSHDYSSAEITELTAVFQRLIAVRDVVLNVNLHYIASAAQADEYRSEPPFRLQGSYRNMNKLAEKISAVMNDAEIEQLIADHYQGESQLLTGGAEENLLKLAEIRGVSTPEQAARWSQIKRDYQRNKAIGGGDKDVGNRIVAQLNDVVEGLRAIAGKRGA